MNVNTISFPGLGLELKFPDGFNIGSLHIYFYGVVIAVGLLLAMWYAFSHFRKVGVDPDKAIDAILGGVIGGLVGARLYYVAFKWEDFKGDFWKIINIRDGGLAIYGGLIGALVVGVLIAKWRKINILALLDIVGVGFLLGQGIGRWGNFFNVEAFGDNTTMPWGMTGPRIVNYLSAHKSELAAVGVTVDPNLPVHPTFLYESLWCLLGFVLLALYLKHRKFDGEVFLLYVGFYGLERAVVEGLRTDSLMIGTLRVSQILAAALFVAALIVWIVMRSRIRSHHDGNYLKLYVLSDEGQRILKGLPDEEEEARKTARQEARKAKKALKAAGLVKPEGEENPEPDGKDEPQAEVEESAAEESEAVESEAEEAVAEESEAEESAVQPEPPEVSDDKKKPDGKGEAEEAVAEESEAEESAVQPEPPKVSDDKKKPDGKGEAEEAVAEESAVQPESPETLNGKKEEDDHGGSDH